MSDRALRKLAARLGAVRGEDAEAVLAALEPAQRRRVAALIAGEPAAKAPPPAPAKAPAQARDLSGLSPWLAVRVAAALGPAVEKDQRSRPAPSAVWRRGTAFSMTPAALDALRLAAEALPAVEPAPRRPTRRLLARLRRTPAQAPA